MERADGIAGDRCQGDGDLEVFLKLGEPSAWGAPNHAAVGDAAHVVGRSDRGKTEPSVKVLRGKLRRKRHLARAGVVRGLQEEPHH